MLSGKTHTGKKFESGCGIDSWTDDLVQRLEATFPCSELEEICLTRGLRCGSEADLHSADYAVSYVPLADVQVPSFGPSISFTAARRRTVAMELSNLSATRVGLACCGYAKEPSCSASLRKGISFGHAGPSPATAPISMTPGCPLWVKSGHHLTTASQPFFPSKQTFVSASGTSA